MKDLSKLLSLLLVIVLITSCGRDPEDTPEPNPDPTVDPIVNNYSGSGSHGDLLTFEINKTDQSYVLYNETTSQTATGSYNILADNNLSGIYHVNSGGLNFFGVELDDKIIAGNFPSGNTQNEITFGVSSEIDNSANTNSIAGDYIYIRLGNVNINGSTSYKEYGVFTLKPNGNLALIDIATGGDGSDSEVAALEDLADLGLDFPIDDSYEYYLEGTWALNGSKKDRFDIIIDGAAYTGYAYAAGTTTVFLMDLGTGNGFAIGFKVYNPTLNNIVGNYKYIDTWSDKSRGAGNYSIGSDGMVNWTYTEDGTDIETGSFGPLNQVDEITNTFYYYNYDGEGNDIYLVLAGDAIMHFIFDDEGNFQAYGVGANL